MDQVEFPDPFVERGYRIMNVFLQNAGILINIKKHPSSERMPIFNY
jgi:hypothetical protein